MSDYTEHLISEAGGDGELTVVGNYLNAYGEPVLATQMPPVSGETPLGGYIVAIGWTCRWIKALAPNTEPIYSGGKLRFEHGSRSITVMPTQWIVWEWDHFRMVPHGAFNSRYTPVNFDITATEASK